MFISILIWGTRAAKNAGRRTAVFVFVFELKIVATTEPLVMVAFALLLRARNVAARWPAAMAGVDLTLRTLAVGLRLVAGIELCRWMEGRIKVIVMKRRMKLVSYVVLGCDQANRRVTWASSALHVCVPLEVCVLLNVAARCAMPVLRAMKPINPENGCTRSCGRMAGRVRGDGLTASCAIGCA